MYSVLKCVHICLPFSSEYTLIRWSLEKGAVSCDLLGSSPGRGSLPSLLGVPCAGPQLVGCMSVLQPPTMLLDEQMEALTPNGAVLGGEALER